MKRGLPLWLAIAGMALNALWPLLANAAPKEFSAPICSMVGTKTASAGAGGAPAQPAPAKFVAPHCPFCLGVSDQSPALTPAAAVLVVAPHTIAQPMATRVSLPVSPLRLRPAPRGPPALP